MEKDNKKHNKKNAMLIMHGAAYKWLHVIVNHGKSKWIYNEKARLREMIRSSWLVKAENKWIKVAANFVGRSTISKDNIFRVLKRFSFSFN